MEDQILPIDDIYVPVKRRATLNEETVKTLALEILEEGQKVPIQVRRDGSRFVLIEGLHRLEACRFGSFWVYFRQRSLGTALVNV